MCIFSSILNCSYANQKNSIISGWKYRANGLLKAFFVTKNVQGSYRFWEKKFHEFDWIFMIFPWPKQQKSTFFSLTFIISLYSFSGPNHMKLKTITLLQNCFSRITAKTSTQQNFISVKKEQFDILTYLVQKPC